MGWWKTATSVASVRRRPKRRVGGTCRLTHLESQGREAFRHDPYTSPKDGTPTEWKGDVHRDVQEHAAAYAVCVWREPLRASRGGQRHVACVVEVCRPLLRSANASPCSPHASRSYWRREAWNAQQLVTRIPQMCLNLRDRDPGAGTRARGPDT